MMATTGRRPSEGPGELASTEDWKVAISETIRELRGVVLTMVDHQVDARLYRLKHLSYVGRREQNRQTREERRIRAENAQQGHPAPSASTPTPGHWATVAADATLTAALRHTSRRLIRHFKARDVPPAVESIAEPTIEDLLTYVLDMALQVTDHKLLAEIHRDLEAVRWETEQAIDGVGRDVLSDPCPYCGQQTLVVDFREDSIQCGPDPRTGLTSACVCPDPLCQCKSKPIEFRHTWYRNPHDPRRTSTGDTWSRLAGRIKFARNIRPTK